jgi:hypothetical protein
MTDIVKVALIAALPGIIAASVGVLSIFKIGRVQEKVDGNISDMRQDLKDATAAILLAREDSKYREGLAAGKEAKNEH